MAKNPRWHRDVNDPKPDTDENAEEGTGFDPAGLDGQDVPAGLSHAELDAVAEHRQVTFSKDGLNRKEKTDEINAAQGSGDLV